MPADARVNLASRDRRVDSTLRARGPRAYFGDVTLAREACRPRLWR